MPMNTRRITIGKPMSCIETEFFLRNMHEEGLDLGANNSGNHLEEYFGVFFGGEEGKMIFY